MFWIGGAGIWLSDRTVWLTQNLHTGAEGCCLGKKVQVFTGNFRDKRCALLGTHSLTKGLLSAPEDGLVRLSFFRGRRLR